MPAIIVENILWSTLFLVGVLNVLTWIVSTVTLCQIFLCSQCLSGRLLKASSV